MVEMELRLCVTDPSIFKWTKRQYWLMHMFLVVNIFEDLKILIHYFSDHPTASLFAIEMSDIQNVSVLF